MAVNFDWISSVWGTVCLYGWEHHPGRLQTDITYNNPQSHDRDHDHLLDPKACQGRSVVNRMRKRAFEETAVRTIYHEEAALAALSAASAILPSRLSISYGARRKWFLFLSFAYWCNIEQHRRSASIGLDLSVPSQGVALQQGKLRDLGRVFSWTRNWSGASCIRGIRNSQLPGKVSSSHLRFNTCLHERLLCPRIAISFLILYAGKSNQSSNGIFYGRRIWLCPETLPTNFHDSRVFRKAPVYFIT